MVVYVEVPQAHPYEGGANVPAHVPLLDLKTAQAQQMRYSQQQQY
jgi:hypothetical protein